MFFKYFRVILITCVFFTGVFGFNVAYANISQKTSIAFEKLISQNKIVMIGEHQLDDVFFILPVQDKTAKFSQLELKDEFQISERLLPALHVLQLLFTPELHIDVKRSFTQSSTPHLSFERYLYLCNFRI